MEHIYLISLYSNNYIYNTENQEKEMAENFENGQK